MSWDALDWHDRINKNNHRVGWAGSGIKGPTFPEAMMLMDMEVAEAAEAWRKWGFEDVTPKVGEPIVGESEPGEAPGLRVRGRKLPKPEGVGSEFADIVIRYLDNCGLFQLPFPDKIAWDGGPPFPEAAESFLTSCKALVNGTTHAVEVWVGGGTLEVPWQQLWRDILFVARVYGIDLEAEGLRKMAFNETREWRHGGRRL